MSYDYSFENGFRKIKYLKTGGWRDIKEMF